MKAARRLTAQNMRLIRIICLALVVSVTIGTVLICNFGRNKSTAYLHSEDEITVDYSVAQLAFDLSSDHMYTYYSESPLYTDSFEPLLVSLNNYITSLDSGEISIGSFNTSVISALKTYYSPDMLGSLENAWNLHNDDQSAYDDATRSIYNEYCTDYMYLFKIKSVLISSVSDDRSIWYYYAKDLLETYYTEYVSQINATGVRQSTMKIGVKLKGGTTYSNDIAGEFYDEQFNTMVNTCTMNFKNSGNVTLYLNLDLNLYTEQNEDKGILCMVLPYGMTWETLKSNEEYNPFYDALNDEWNYHGLIRELLMNKDGGFVSAASGTDASDVYGSLTYASTQDLLNEWNEYAIETYSTDPALNVNAMGNTLVYESTSTQDDVLKNIQISMLFWADYEKCAENYAADNPGLEWKADDEYELFRYTYAVDIKTSLKNSDMSLYTPTDWAEMFNKQENFEKFAGISNFDIEGYAFFEKKSGGVTTVENAKNYMEGGYIICNYVDSNAMNYVGNLRFNVEYRGFSPAYIRVRFIEQFTNTSGEIEAVNRLVFSLGDTWVDNRMSDLYFYSNELFYSTDNSGTTTIGKPKRLSIPVIKGLDPSIASVGDIDDILVADTTMKLKVSFYVEAVQPNRTEEYWNISLDDINSMYS